MLETNIHQIRVKKTEKTNASKELKRWFPILGWIVWLLGFIFSFVGIFKRPKEMAISGLVISLIGSILIIFAFRKISTINLGIYY